MAQTSSLINTLKKALKAQGKTYLDVADALNLSEPSIKRMFADEHITLKRLDRICEMLDLELSELILMMQDNSDLISQLTKEQEQDLVSDIDLFLVAVSCLNRWSFSDIIDTYDFSEASMRQHLRRLEKLKFLQLLAGDRIRVLVSRNFAWLPDGPIQRFFNQKIQNEFFASSFEQQGEKLSVITAMLSPSSNAIVQQRIERLLGEFSDLEAEDARLPINKRFGTTMVVAIRPWELEAFEERRREDTLKTFK